MAVRSQRQSRVGRRDEGARLGFRLTLPAQMLVLFISVFPLLMQLYISLTDWSPLSGIGWWNAWELWNSFANYTDLAADGRFWSALWRTAIVMIGLRAGRVPARPGAGHAVHRRISGQAALLLDPADADDGGAGGRRLHVLHAVPVGRAGERHPFDADRLSRHDRLALRSDAGAVCRHGRRHLAVDAADVPDPARRPGRRAARIRSRRRRCSAPIPGSASPRSCCRR